MPNLIEILQKKTQFLRL